MLAYRGFQGEPIPRLVEIDAPTPGDGDVQVRIKSSGLTYGTFTLQKAGLLKPMPMTLGHEGAGVVEAVGAGVTRFKAGDRVRIHPTLSCGGCRRCLTGLDHMCWGVAMMGFVSFEKTVPAYDRYHNGFLAEFAVAPETHVDLLPDTVSFDAGAKLHYAGNAIRTLKAAELPPMATLGILGATGSMGVVTIKLAEFFGVKQLVLIGRSTERLEQAAKLSGVPTTIVSTDALPADWAEAGGLARAMGQAVPDGLDAIIDFLPEGGPMLQAVAGGLSVGGVFVNMGGGPQPFGFPMRMMVRKCWKVVGTRNHTRLDAKEALELMAAGVLTLDDLITHRDPLADVDKAVERMNARTEPVWMSVVHP